MKLCQKWIYEKQGGHYWVSVYSGPDLDHLAKCGDLCFREEELFPLLEQMKNVPRFLCLPKNAI